jgi:RHS repeat-associated protein
LNAAGVYVGAGGLYSDVFTYDERSNIAFHVDARGVKAVFDYGNDPLNRLQQVTYDTSGVGDTNNPILDTSSISYEYVTSGDLTRRFRVTTEFSSEEYAYNEKGLLSSQLLITAVGFPMAVDYNYDSADRLVSLRYPIQYGTTGANRRLVQYDYDLASRFKEVRVDDVVLASQLDYFGSGLLRNLRIGQAGDVLDEKYSYSATTGLIDFQGIRYPATPAVWFPETAFMYRNSMVGVDDGQLTRIRAHDSLFMYDQTSWRNRSYEYDGLGRLIAARGGNPDAPLWSQQYAYDDYGNRTGVTQSGNSANGQPMPADGLVALNYDESRNRITTPGYSYDAAGNLTRAQRADGMWHRYQYDAANRLVRVLDDTGVTLESYIYGACRRRWVTEHGQSDRTYYVWDGDKVIAEFQELAASPGTIEWTRSYVHLGSRLLGVLSGDGADSSVQYCHPDRLGTRVLITSEGAVQEQVTLPFGVDVDAESTGRIGQRFTTYDRSDVTGLDYAVNRFYDPQQGRFIQPDPTGLGTANLKDPQSLNLYSYVGNDPVNTIDPVGLEELYCYIGPNERLTCSAVVVVEGRVPSLVWIQSPRVSSGIPASREQRGERRRDEAEGKSPELERCPDLPHSHIPGQDIHFSTDFKVSLPLISPLPPQDTTISSISSAEIEQGRVRMMWFKELRGKYPGLTIEDLPLMYSAYMANIEWKMLNDLAPMVGRYNAYRFYQEFPNVSPQPMPDVAPNRGVRPSRPSLPNPLCR